MKNMFELEFVRVKDSPRWYPFVSRDPADVELKLCHVTIVCPHAWQAVPSTSFVRESVT
jgi:hypothetical protein